MWVVGGTRGGQLEEGGGVEEGVYEWTGGVLELALEVDWEGTGFGVGKGRDLGLDCWVGLSRWDWSMNWRLGGGIRVGIDGIGGRIGGGPELGLQVAEAVVEGAWRWASGRWGGEDGDGSGGGLEVRLEASCGLVPRRAGGLVPFGRTQSMSHVAL